MLFKQFLLLSVVVAVFISTSPSLSATICDKELYTPHPPSEKSPKAFLKDEIASDKFPKLKKRGYWPVALDGMDERYGQPMVAAMLVFTPQPTIEECRATIKSCVLDKGILFPGGTYTYCVEQATRTNVAVHLVSKP